MSEVECQLLAGELDWARKPQARGLVAGMLREGSQAFVVVARVMVKQEQAPRLARCAKVRASPTLDLPPAPPGRILPVGVLAVVDQCGRATR